MSDKPRVTTEGRGPLLLIGLDRPEKMKAFDSVMLLALSDAFGELERCPDYRCGVLFAHGDHFTAGLDLMEVAPLMTQGKLDLGPEAIDPWGVQGRQGQKPMVGAFHG